MQINMQNSFQGRLMSPVIGGSKRWQILSSMGTSIVFWYLVTDQRDSWTTVDRPRVSYSYAQTDKPVNDIFEVLVKWNTNGANVAVFAILPVFVVEIKCIDAEDNYNKVYII